MPSTHGPQISRTHDDVVHCARPGRPRLHLVLDLPVPTSEPEKTWLYPSSSSPPRLAGHSRPRLVPHDASPQSCRLVGVPADGLALPLLGDLVPAAPRPLNIRDGGRCRCFRRLWIECCRRAGTSKRSKPSSPSSSSSSSSSSSWSLSSDNVPSG